MYSDNVRSRNPHKVGSKASKADPNKNREKNKMFAVPDMGIPSVSEEAKKDAMLVMSGISIRMKLTPVDLETVLFALNLKQKTSLE